MHLVHLTELTEKLEKRVLEVGDLDALIQILNVDSGVWLAHGFAPDLFQLGLEAWSYITWNHIFFLLFINNYKIS